MLKTQNDDRWDQLEKDYSLGKRGPSPLAVGQEGTREDLILHLARRRVQDMEVARDRALDQALERVGGAPLPVADIVDARLLPVAELTIDSILHDGHVHKGLARLFGESPDFKKRMLAEVFPTSTARFLHEFGRSLSQICAEEIEERFWMSHASLLGSLAMLDRHHDPEHPTRGEQAMWNQVYLLRDAMCGLFLAPSRPKFHTEMVHFRDGARQWQVPRDHISSVHADGDYSKVWQTDGTSHYLRRTLRQWEEVLPPPDFCRVHRSAIVNLHHLVSPEVHTDSILVKGTPDPIPVSRRKQEELAKILEQITPLREGWVGIRNHSF